MKLTHSFELMLLGAIWGASFLFMRVAAPEFGPVPLIGIRVGLAGLVLLPIFLMRKPFKSLFQSAGHMLFVSVFNSALPFSLFAYATLYLTSGVTAILNATVSIFAALVAYVWLKESLTFSRVAGLILGFGGVCALVLTSGAITQINTVLAVCAGLAASLSYAVSACYIKCKLKSVDSLTLTTSSMIGAFLLMLPFTMFFWPEQPPTFTAWLSVIALSVICTGLALILYFKLLSQIGMAKSATVGLVVPMFAILWGAIWLDEVLTLKMGIAALTILFGTVLAANLFGIDRLIARKDVELT